ncbi:MAG: MBL fold metallo-hydrolase [Chitinispirillia bacterium]|nr:MBL fold metallo-hydrolase [Chitinispirillia bacterium]MCL2241788.1 MBL fold metallo-hydrolase [Chitinispirillia bacterium]
MRLKSKSFAVMFLLLSLNAFAAKPIVIEGGFEVTVFDEVPGREMGVELFDGPMTKEQRLAFMPGGKAPAAVNVFVVKAGGKTYLIDAGFGNAVKDKRVDPSKIDVVLITHAHGDHIGGLLKEDGAVNFAKPPVFISKPESAYWLDPKTQNSDLAKNVAKAYGERYKKFAFGDTLAPGIVAVDAAGHTPGHTAFLIGTGKQKLLIAADFLHAAALQFPNPEESASFDVDKKKSAEARKKLMQMCVDNGWLIGGMHIPGGVGTVKGNGKGGFEFKPWQ